MIKIPEVTFGAVLILLAILAALLAWRSSKDRASAFNFEEAFLDANGKTSIGRIAAFVALACSTWAFVFLVLNDKITEWYFAGYMGAWVVNGISSKYLESK